MLASITPAPTGVDASERCDLYVDVDGTLLRTDLFVEAAWRYLRLAPWRIFQLIAVLMRSRAAAKAFLARKVDLDPSLLPYQEPLIEHLKKPRSGSVILITASHWRYARRIARHLGLFDGVEASSAKVNLKGERKLARIRQLSGCRPFVYAGDSAADRPIWRSARRVIMVGAPPRDVAWARRTGNIELVIHKRASLLRSFIREMRLHQWAKNLLLFVPLLTSHTYGSAVTVATGVMAFCMFGLCASGHYFLNDLLDLDADRAHPRKRNRPLASGDLPLLWGLFGAVALPILAFALSLAFLPAAFNEVLTGYFLLTNLYSFWLKRVSTADVFTLAMLYTVRVAAGAAAISVELSSWLLAFSMFMFVSLAYLKRYIEVTALSARTKAVGRGYSGADAETMFALGIANAITATLVLASYISRPEVTIMYHRPQLLWGVCLLLLYWNNRIWLGARRGKIHEDPVLFAVKDKVSRLLGAAALAVVLVAHF